MGKKNFVRVLTSFDHRSNLGLIRGTLVILAERDTLGAPMLERVVLNHSKCSRGPMWRKIFLDFSRSSTQIEGR